MCQVNLRMSSSRPPSTTQVYSSQMFGQESLIPSEEDTSSKKPSRFIPGCWKQFCLSCPCSTDFPSGAQIPLFQRRPRELRDSSTWLAGGPLPFHTTHAGSDCGGTYGRFKEQGSGALGRLRSGVSPRPLGSQERDILSGVAGCQGHSSHPAQSAEQEMSSGFLCPTPAPAPRPTAQLGFGRWGEPGHAPAPKNRARSSLKAHPHPRTGLLPLNAPGWREMAGQPVSSTCPKAPRRCCLFRISGPELSSLRSCAHSLHISPTLWDSPPVTRPRECQLSKRTIFVPEALFASANRISRPPAPQGHSLPSGALSLWL